MRASLVTDNLFALFRTMATRLRGGVLDESAAVARHAAPPPNPLFRGVWATRLADADLDPTIDEQVAWFAAHDAVPWFWWVEPEATPAALPARLAARGLTESEPGGAAMMVAAIDRLDLARASALGITVAPVRDDTDLEAWKNVAIAAFSAPPPLAQAWVDATRELGLPTPPGLPVSVGHPPAAGIAHPPAPATAHPPAPATGHPPASAPVARDTRVAAPWHLWLAREGDRPVGCSLTFAAAGAVGLFVIGAVPDVRGRGIGAAITLAPLLAARADGETTAVLFANDSGAPVYARLGFADTGAKLRRFRYARP